MKCLYHLDADGKCAAYLIRRQYTCRPEDFLMVNYGWDYMDWLITNVEPDEEVYIVDFSIEPEEMKALREITKNVIWIDHHKSAIEKYKDHFEDDEIYGIRCDGIAGCMLTAVYIALSKDMYNKTQKYNVVFNYYFSKDEVNDYLTNTDPKNFSEYLFASFVEYIADYDVWKYKYGDRTRNFILGFDTLGEMLPFDPQWGTLYKLENIYKLQEAGKAIATWRDSVAENYRKNNAYARKVYDYDVLFWNQCTGNSIYFGDEIENYDAVCLYSYSGKHQLWEYSFYSVKEDVDCSAIVTRMKLENDNILSAGGHKGASGLQSRILLEKFL